MDVFVGLGVNVCVSVGVSVLENGRLTSPLEQRESKITRSISKNARSASAHFLFIGVFYQRPFGFPTTKDYQTIDYLTNQKPSRS